MSAETNDCINTFAFVLMNTFLLMSSPSQMCLYGPEGVLVDSGHCTLKRREHMRGHAGTVEQSARSYLDDTEPQLPNL